MKEKSEYIEKLVAINRITKVVKGGRRFGFAALVVVGNQKGSIGVGQGKSKQVPDAIKKASEVAKKSMIKVPLKDGRTLHHDIYGRNGSGKSTLIRIILGITEPVKGTLENKSTKEICYLGHKNALKTYLTLDDNINLMQLTNCDMLKSYLDKLELNKYRDVTVSNLSFGQQKKLALLRVFLNNSDLIILDEPFVGLDDGAHTVLTSFLNNELDQNKSLVFTSHIPCNINSKVLEIPK